MTNLIEQAVMPMIKAEDGDEHLLAYIEAGPAVIELQGDGLEMVEIQRDKAGNVVVATSRKLPNLRFRLGEMLLEVTGTGMAVAGSLDKPLKLVLTGIRFLRSIRKMSTLDVSKSDAAMLIAIFRLVQEEGAVQVDALQGLLPDGWNEREMALSLERLERLGCIGLEMEGIVVNEVIVVQGAR